MFEPQVHIVNNWKLLNPLLQKMAFKVYVLNLEHVGLEFCLGLE